MFTDVNENDAKAAVKAWGQTVARERRIPVDPDPTIYKDTAALLAALRSKTVDAVGITLVDYAVLSLEIRFAPIFVTQVGGKPSEQYLLLVHQDSHIDRLTDLRGHSLTLHQNPRTCLAQPWLDTLLAQNGGKPTAEFVGKITQSLKLSKAILPVFFRQSDACVVTRTGFETMVELNPQLGKQLKIIASSPEVVPAVFCFREDYSPIFKEDLFAGIRDLHKSVAGQQVLTVFQSVKIEDQPASCLDSALGILARQARLVGLPGTTNGSQKAGTSGAGGNP
jgi:phosphonate transport system substrate-binding protein